MACRDACCHDVRVIDPTPWWDFAQPALSERRFREQAADAEGADAEEWLTQVARALGLQRRFEEAHTVLDGLAADVPVVAARLDLERGRLLRSSGDEPAARPHFESAAVRARAAGAEALEVDALHMVALVAAPEEQVDLTRAALDVARAARDPRARDWDASLLNNLGMAHVEAGDHAAALAAFEEALEARVRIGDDARTRVARWMVGWTLRLLGRTEEALAVQQALRSELDAAGEHDPHVDEELALLGAGQPAG